MNIKPKTALWEEQRKRDEDAREAAWERAHALCNCPAGRTADAERWLPALVEFVAGRGRMPGPQETAMCKARGVSRDAELIDVDREARSEKRPQNLAPLLDRLRKAMLETHSKRVFRRDAIEHKLIFEAEQKTAAAFDPSKLKTGPIAVSDSLRKTLAAQAEAGQ